jgi:ribonuclease P protein component
VLPAAARVHTRYDHRLVAQTGCRVRRGSLVIALATDGSAGPRATVIAGRRVGPAVVRNRVKRRVREILRPRLETLPPGSMLVVRALPGAADADFGQLGSWVDAGVRGCSAAIARAQTGSGAARD